MAAKHFFIEIYALAPAFWCWKVELFYCLPENYIHIDKSWLHVIFFLNRNVVSLSFILMMSMCVSKLMPGILFTALKYIHAWSGKDDISHNPQEQRMFFEIISSVGKLMLMLVYSFVWCWDRDKYENLLLSDCLGWRQLYMNLQEVNNWHRVHAVYKQVYQLPVVFDGLARLAGWATGNLKWDQFEWEWRFICSNPHVCPPTKFELNCLWKHLCQLF